MDAATEQWQEVEDIDVADVIDISLMMPMHERSGLNHTDLGNAERLAAWGKHWLRHVYGVGWLVWNETRWRRDPAQALVHQVAKHTVRDIYSEAAYFNDHARQATDSSEREKWAAKAEAAISHARRSENGIRIREAINLARHEHGIAVLDEDGMAASERLDANPNLLNTPDGTLDLETFTLQEHDPQDLITKVTNASYDPQAACPEWIEFVEMVLPDPATREYVQKAAGYSLLGSYSEYLFVPYGEGQNGKSTFLEALRDVLGDYATTLEAQLLTPQRGGHRDAGAYSALADLRGVRLVTTVETEQGRELAESFVKELTGEGVLRAKYMRQDMFEFENKTAVWLGTNHLPIIRGSDFAIWRRLRLIPFTTTIPQEQRRPHLEVRDMMRAERDGILQWLIEGLKLYLHNGLNTPPEVTAATANWQRESDPVVEWMDDCCSFSPTGMTPVALVTQSYQDHCLASGRKPLGARRLNEALKRKGCEQSQSRYLGNSVKVWNGVSVSTVSSSSITP